MTCRASSTDGGGMVCCSTAVFLPFLRVLAGAPPATVEAFDYLKAPEHTVEESVERLGAHIVARTATSTYCDGIGGDDRQPCRSVSST